MMRYITVDGTKFRIRGNYSAKQLRELFPKVQAQFPGTKITFREWLIRYGKVYSRVNPTR